MSCGMLGVGLADLRGGIFACEMRDVYVYSFA